MEYFDELNIILDGGRKEYWFMADRIPAIERFLKSGKRIYDLEQASELYEKLRTSSALRKQMQKGSLDFNYVRSVFVDLGKHITQEKARKQCKKAIAPESDSRTMEEAVDVLYRHNCISRLAEKNEQKSWRRMFRKATNYIGSIFNPQRVNNDFSVLDNLIKLYDDRYPNPNILAIDGVIDNLEGSLLSESQMHSMIGYRQKLNSIRGIETHSQFQRMLDRNISRMDGMIARYYRIKDRHAATSWLARQPRAGQTAFA